MIARIAPALASLLLIAGCSGPAASHVAVDQPTKEEASPVDARVEAIRAELAVHRAQQIERLHAYALAGQFPHNYDVAPSLHMFRDASGRYCAVANLIHQSGRDDLVEETVRTRNDLAIADVNGGPIMDWILASGLTKEELVRIQLPAPPIQRVEVKPQAKPDPMAHRFTPPGAIREKEMNDAVHAHALAMEEELRAKSAESLDLALARYVAAHGVS